MAQTPTMDKMKMISFLNPIIQVKIKSAVYRFRFLGLYIFFGILSLIVEFLIRSYLINLGNDSVVSTFFSVSCGILFAFSMNVNFNFKIMHSKRNRALVYFVIISSFSGLIQWISKEMIFVNSLNYELSRLSISGSLFLIGYFLHRRYTFRDFKKVGVAIYANGVENLKEIHNKIGSFPDFIHVDMVDETMSDKADDIKTYKLETMKAFWPDKQVQTHIMSMNPTKWLKEVLLYSDVVFVHAECKENVSKILEEIRECGKIPGLALQLSTKPKDVSELLKKSDYVLLLTIPNPGSSGQKFDQIGIERIKELNNLSFRKKFTLCVDGGINEKIVSHIKAENIVSGSSVLLHKNPKNQILRLQTSGMYES